MYYINRLKTACISIAVLTFSLELVGVGLFYLIKHRFASKSVLTAFGFTDLVIFITILIMYFLFLRYFKKIDFGLDGLSTQERKSITKSFMKGKLPVDKKLAGAAYTYAQAQIALRPMRKLTVIVYLAGTVLILVGALLGVFTHQKLHLTQYNEVIFFPLLLLLNVFSNGKAKKNADKILASASNE
jgi:hypothetical protein